MPVHFLPGIYNYSFCFADYTSEKLDLNDPKTFRDLSKPMGAIGTKVRCIYISTFLFSTTKCCVLQSARQAMQRSLSNYARLLWRRHRWQLTTFLLRHPLLVRWICLTLPHAASAIYEYGNGIAGTVVLTLSIAATHQHFFRAVALTKLTDYF